LLGKLSGLQNLLGAFSGRRISALREGKEESRTPPCRFFNSGSSLPNRFGKLQPDYSKFLIL
jgi:hypothetical protein